MNKTEAAKYLGVGVRTLERYTSEGRLSPGRRRTKTGPALDYDPADLERFKAALQAEQEQVLAAPTAAPPPAMLLSREVTIVAASLSLRAGRVPAGTAFQTVCGAHEPFH